jgi:hypothetical protein
MNTEIDKQKCSRTLSLALADLKANPSLDKLDSISDLIIQSMTGPWRFFHTPEHIFQVGEGGDSIEVISALFHDMVYVQVDQGINVNIARLISPFIQENNKQLFLINDPDLLSDPLFKLTLDIFGFKQGNPLQPMAGQNEFLSALLAAKIFDEILSLGQIAQIIACIEATIPFRSTDTFGLSCSEKLFQNLKVVNENFKFSWSDEEIHKIVERGVRLSNRDVENFASTNPAHFLDNTWNLIPETNHDLMKINTYTASGYRVSLQKMDGFLGFLKPDIVFRKYRNEPSEVRFKELTLYANRNLEIARLYLGMKLTSIAFLEALSMRIGRNISVAMFMGELPVDNQPNLGLEQFLPKITKPMKPNSEIELEVLSLLEIGRSVNSEYDVKNSPIATIMTKSLGFNDMRILLLKARQFFKGEISSELFIDSCPKELTNKLIEAIIKFFDERRNKLLAN